MTTYVRNGTHHTTEATNLTEQHVADDKYEALLWGHCRAGRRGCDEPEG